MQSYQVTEFTISIDFNLKDNQELNETITQLSTHKVLYIKDSTTD